MGFLALILNRSSVCFDVRLVMLNRRVCDEVFSLVELSLEQLSFSLFHGKRLFTLIPFHNWP